MIRGRRRHGLQRKESKTVSLDPEVIERLERLGADATGKLCLSRGIEIAEHCARMSGKTWLQGAPPPRAAPKAPPRGWIVFELVEGEADPPPAGETIDAWREVLTLTD